RFAALWICRRVALVSGGLSHGGFVWPVARSRTPAGRRNSQCDLFGDDHVRDFHHGTESLRRDDDLVDGNVNRTVVSGVGRIGLLSFNRSFSLAQTGAPTECP